MNTAREKATSEKSEIREFENPSIQILVSNLQGMESRKWKDFPKILNIDSVVLQNQISVGQNHGSF